MEELLKELWAEVDTIESKMTSPGLTNEGRDQLQTRKNALAELLDEIELNGEEANVYYLLF
jgi:hypothetical protein